MKIGVVTWFKYENYGTVLQALALQCYLNKKDYDAELIHFNLNDSENKKANNISLSKKIYYKIGWKIFIKQQKKYKECFIAKSNSFKKIITDNCVISDEIRDEDDYIEKCNKYDFLIFGSDQIWNPNWYHPFYYGNFKKINKKLIAYAPSFGVSDIEGDIVDKLKGSLERFSNIALREESGCKIVERIIGKKADIVADPTMLLTATEWEKYQEPIDNLNNDYILCYFLSDNPKHWRAATKFAKKINKKLVIIPHGGYSYIKSKYVIKDCSPGNFIYLIKNAHCILTDSYHATVFSIIFRKKFIVIERHNPKNKDSQNSRIYNLVNLVKADEALLKYNTSKINEIPQIDYLDLSTNLESIIEHSKAYLKETLKKE